MKVRSDSDFAAALATLRQHLADLEREMSLVECGLDQEFAAALVWEKRAMSAIRRGDDWTARDALMRFAEHIETTGVPKADLKVLKAIAEECRVAIAEAEQRQSAGVSTEPT
jgi:phage shock protein A